MALVEVLLAAAVAPTALAFLNATTPSDWLIGAPLNNVTDCVLVTVALVSTVGAVAVQISDTPRDVPARWRGGQGRPPPVTVSVWVFVPVGNPSDPTSATSTSPATVVL